MLHLYECVDEDEDEDFDLYPSEIVTKEIVDAAAKSHQVREEIIVCVYGYLYRVFGGMRDINIITICLHCSCCVACLSTVWLAVYIIELFVSLRWLASTYSSMQTFVHLFIIISSYSHINITATRSCI